MKLRYFVAPHEMLDQTSGKLMPCTLETIAKNDLGMWVTIGIEKSEVPRLLPLMSLVGTNKQGQPMDMLSPGTNRLAQQLGNCNNHKKFI